MKSIQSRPAFSLVLLFSLLTGFLSPVASAKNLVSVDAAITEIIYALNAQEQLVAVDTTSTFPQAATKLPQVGYIRALTAEGIMSVAPDLLLTNYEAGPAEALVQLEQLGVQVVQFDTQFSIAGVADLIAQVAQNIGKEKQGEQLLQAFEAQIEQVINKHYQQKVMFVMNGGARGLMVAGQGTRADALIQLSGGQNAFSEFHGYKPLSAEGVMLANPDLILIMHSEDDMAKWQNHVALVATKAAQNQRIYSIDGLDLLTFGPRLPNAIAQVQAWLNHE